MTLEEYEKTYGKYIYNSAVTDPEHPGFYIGLNKRSVMALLYFDGQEWYEAGGTRSKIPKTFDWARL